MEMLFRKKRSFCIIFTLFEKGTIAVKLITCVMLTLLASPAVWLWYNVRDYVITDVGFIKILSLCIIADLITGVWKHLRNHTFDWIRLYTGLLEKIGISFIGMVLFNSIGSIQHLDKMGSVTDYLIMVGKLVNVTYVAGSAFTNMYSITGGKFPPVGWMNKLKNFNNTLDVRQFKDSEGQDTVIVTAPAGMVGTDAESAKDTTENNSPENTD